MSQVIGVLSLDALIFTFKSFSDCKMQLVAGRTLFKVFFVAFIA